MSITVPIETTFDISTARNLLRIRSSRWGCTPQFRLRASAVLVALAEMVLMSHAVGVLDIEVTTTPENHLRIGFKFDVSSSIARKPWLEDAIERLRKVSDQVDFSSVRGHEQISASICAIEEISNEQPG
jgi:hypothetical protein